jgi:hypothetical protein
MAWSCGCARANLALPHALQGGTPRDRLVEHGVDLLFVQRRRLEPAELLEIGEQRQHQLIAHVRQHQLAHREPQGLDRPPPMLP